MKKVIGVGILVLVLMYSACSSKEKGIYNNFLRDDVSEKVVDFLNVYNTYGEAMMDEDVELTQKYRRLVDEMWEVLNNLKREDFTEADVKILQGFSYFAETMFEKGDDDYTRGCIIVIELRRALNNSLYGKSIS